MIHLALHRDIGLGEGLPKPGVEAFDTHLRPHLLYGGVLHLQNQALPLRSAHVLPKIDPADVSHTESTLSASSFDLLCIAAQGLLLWLTTQWSTCPLQR